MNLAIYIGFMIFIKVIAKSKEYCTQSSFNKLLSRKKRFLTFPDGSSFAVKRSFSKAIIDNIPKGMNLNIDCGIYYPLPGSRDPWNPDKLFYRLNLAKTGGLSATQKPKLKPKLGGGDYFMKTFLDEKNIHPDMYFPFDHHSTTNRWIRNGNGYITNSTADDYYIRNRMRKNYNIVNRNIKGDINTTYRKQVPWTNNREFRERREIYKHTEGLGHIFGINMKACIMRAICEMNDDFLPTGKSLIQDIARIFFDVPTDNSSEDDYGIFWKQESVDCIKRFIFTCPYSPMEFLLRIGRLKGVQEYNKIQTPLTYF